MKPGHTHEPENCAALGDILARIGDKWSVFVVGRLADGPVRFNELRRSINGVSQRMLTLTLKGLERDGLVTRTVYPTIPPKVEYALTELGCTLIRTLNNLADWARVNKGKVDKARASYDAKKDKAVEPARIPVRPRVASAAKPAARQ